LQKSKDPEDEKKELEEAFIESLEIETGKEVNKATVKEKRKSKSSFSLYIMETCYNVHRKSCKIGKMINGIKLV